MLRIKDGERLLFIGDSITDCDWRTLAPPLGTGYVQFVSCFLAARHPQIRLEILNQGTAGETILDLEARWEEDVIAQRPDWLFVMIGVTDVLSRFVGGEPERAVADRDYLAAYRRLFRRTRERLDCRVVLLEPTPLEEDPAAESHRHMRRLVELVRQAAQEFDAEVIPLFDRFRQALERAPGAGWLIDVPHPSLKGQALLALAVLEHLGWEVP